MNEETNKLLYTSNKAYKLYEPPKPIGYWCLYRTEGFSTQFAMYDKPTAEQIKNTENALGWVWRDA